MMQDQSRRGMAGSDDENTRQGRRNRQTRAQLIGTLVSLEIADKIVSSVRYRLSQAKPPHAKELRDFEFAQSEVSERMMRQLTALDLRSHCCNIVLFGGTGAGKIHLAEDLVRQWIRDGPAVGFSMSWTGSTSCRANATNSRRGRLVDQLSRVRFVVLDELKYLPFPRAGGQLLFHRISKLYEQVTVVVTNNLRFGEWNLVFEDEKMTTTLVGRLTHHCKIVDTGNRSWRFHHRSALSLSTESRV